MPNTTKTTIAEIGAIQARVAALDKRDNDIKARLAPIFKKVWNPERDLVHVTDLSVFQALKSRLPHFSEVLNLWEANAIATSMHGLPFQSPPILLVGDAGLGKTYFAKEVATALSLAYFELSMATITASFVISGHSIGWAEGEAGFIAQSLADSPVANPILLLDEIDKASGGYKYDPLGPLYPLLEPYSSRRFRDEALEIELDASHIIWVGTANYIEQVPDPIQSRMRIIEVLPPDTTQMPAVTRSIYQGIRATQPYGFVLDPVLSEDVIERVNDLSPRKAKLALEDACMNAIRAGRSQLVCDDVVVPQERKVRYGFL